MPGEVEISRRKPKCLQKAKLMRNELIGTEYQKALVI